MTASKQLDLAARKMDEAMARINEARAQPFSEQSQREWLEGLTDFCFALSDAQEFNNESVHEKLHEIAGGVGAERVLLGKGRSRPR